MVCFFKPWIGPDYDNPFKISDRCELSRLLVIGASRYCPITDEKEVINCHNLCENQLKLSALKEIENGRLCRRAEITARQNLNYSDINEIGILDSLEDDPIRTYELFQKGIKLLYLDSPSDSEIWKRIAFINFIHPITRDGRYPKKTPEYDSNKRMYEISKSIVEGTIAKLRPSLIILWQCCEFNEKVLTNYMFNNIKEIHDDEVEYESDSQKQYANKVYEICIKDKKYPLLTSPHPSRGLQGHFYKRITLPKKLVDLDTIDEYSDRLDCSLKDQICLIEHILSGPTCER